MKRRLLTLLAALLLMLPAGAMATETGTSARACVIIDEKSGRILLSHNEDAPLPMASTTKVMTALLAIELGDPDAPVTCSRNAFGVPGTSIYLSEGETLTLRDMLYGLMLASGNDAATAIAEHIGGSVADFCRMMTARAAELGCTNTVFLTPHGLPQEGHYTTARDLALIAREAMTHELFREIVGTQRATIPWEGRGYDRVLNNKNRLLSTYEGATGMKTGYTKKAGRCLVFGAERDGMRIIGVVLNCADWFDEAARLMDKAFEQYEAVTLLRQGDCAGTLQVAMSDVCTVEALLSADLTGVAPRGTVPQAEIDLPDMIEAPVRAGQIVGSVRLVCGGEIIAETPLVASCDAARDDLPARWHFYWQNWFALN
ncbi:MAG: D-alanyl-D-alanine carboxypeptidase [Clostridia bacterium]|nr:D-alanyl-D-alanine carboxypeptidase [Clostridia bacterium]